MRLLTDVPGGREALTRPACLIVVHRTSESTYRYLKDRLAGVRGIELTLDRRTPRSPAAPISPGDRRGRSPQFNAFGVLVVRR
jgi:hypothetical protein